MSSADAPKLRLIHGKVSKDFVGPNTVVLGRSNEADFVVSSEWVSRLHAKLRIHDGALWITDLRSANGTWVNGTTVPPDIETRIPPYAVVMLGNQDAIVHAEILLEIQQEMQTDVFPNDESPKAETAMLRDDTEPGIQLDIQPVKGSPDAERILLLREIAQLDVRRNGLQFEVTALQVQSRNLTAACVGLESKIGELESNVSGLKREIEVKSFELSVVSDRLHAAKGARTQADELAIESQRIAEQSQKQARDALAQLEALRHEENTAREKVAELDRQCAILSDSAEDAKKNVLDAEIALQKDRDETEALRLEAAQLHSVLKDLQSARSDAEYGLEPLRREIAGLEATFRKEKAANEAELSANLERQQQVIETLNMSVRKIRAEQELEQTEAHLRKAQLEVDIQNLVTRKATADAELMVTRMDAEKIGKTAEAISAELENTERDLHEKKGSLEVLTSEAESVSKRHQEIAETVKSLERQARELDSEIDQNRKHAERENADERKRVEQELASIRAERKRTLDLELAELKVREMAVAEDRVKQEGRERKNSRRRDAEMLSQQLEQALVVRLRNAQNLSSELPKLIPAIVNEVMFPDRDEANITSQRATVLPKDVISQQSAKRFWARLGAGLALAAIAGLVWLIAPGFYPMVARKVGAVLKPERSPSDMFVQRVQDQRTLRMKYEPSNDPIYKSTFTENILRTSRYAEMKEKAAMQKRWVVELNAFFINELGLKENAIVRFAASEIALVRELINLKMLILPNTEREGIARMAEAEARGEKELKSIIGESNYDRYREFEARFYQTFLENIGPEQSAK